MHSSGTDPFTFIWGTILAWGGTFLAWGVQAVIWGGAQLRNAPVAPGSVLTIPSIKKLTADSQWRIQKILVGGDLKHKTSKIRMS